MLLKIDKYPNFKNILLIILIVFLFTLNLSTEIVNQVKISSFLSLKSLLTILIIFLIKDDFKKYQKKIKFLLTFFTILFFINIVLNMINVYSIDCYIGERLCSTISFLFYKFKIFRFITLSSYFFTIPILLLIFLMLDLKLKVKKIKLSQVFFFLILGVIIFSNLTRNFQAIYSSIIQSYQVIDENYYDRFTFKKGGAGYYGWIRVFSNFIINNTKEKSNILVPPQSDTYKMEGNINYFRWFMYPKKLFHLEDLDNKKEIKIDYVVLSAGECDNKECVWPNYQISKNKIDKIIILDRENQSINEIYNTDYIPTNFYQKWGLIKLK